MKIKNTYYILLAFCTVPSIAFGAESLTGYLVALIRVVNLAIPVMYGLALLFFFWGTGQFVLNAGNEKIRDDGKRKMLWSVLVIFVMVTLFGILGFFGRAIGLPINGSTGGGSGFEEIPCTNDPGNMC